MHRIIAYCIVVIIQFASVHYFTKHGSGEIDAESEDDENSDDEYYDDDVLFDGKKQKIFCTTNNHKRNSHTNYHLDGAVYPAPNGFAYSPHKRNNKRLKSRQRRRVHDTFCTQFLKCIQGDQEYRERRRRRIKANQSADYINSVSKIDQTARILFPAIFVSFNIFYWITYLYTATDGSELML